MCYTASYAKQLVMVAHLLASSVFMKIYSSLSSENVPFNIVLIAFCFLPVMAISFIAHFQCCQIIFAENPKILGENPQIFPGIFF